MEKVLNQILETLRQHGEQLKTLEQGQSRLENRIKGLEQGQSRLENRIEGLEQGQSHLENRIGGLEQGQNRLENRIEGLERKTSQLNSGLLKLEARMENEVIDKVRALFDDRSLNQDYFAGIKDSLARVEDRVEFLARQNIEHLDKLQKHDRELRLLRAERK